jgi:CRISPR-associated protein Cmr1
MREPKIDTVPPIQPDYSGYVRQTREYKLITPLFGGGVAPAEADPVTVIRGTEVRGHLRFWWRACRGGQFNGDLGQMKEAEDKLWGAASTEKRPRASRVQIEVKILDPGRPFIVHDRRGNRVDISHFGSPYSYAAFPLEAGQTVQEEVHFELKLAFPKTVDGIEVEATLWAWETFGGIGGRTRRGFGALECISINGVAQPVPAYEQVSEHLRHELDKHVISGMFPLGVPHLTPAVEYKITSEYSGPLVAWRNLLQALKRFRQARNPGTAPNRPGRSRWPEPDAIRRKTGQRARQHSQPISSIEKFPRAAFGLPIVFHFKDQRQGDPSTTVLQGADFDRLASPLVLRPVACAGGKAVGIALILETPREPPGGLVLKDVPGPTRVDRTLTPSEARQIQPLRGNVDVLKAFLDTL